jgi:hypothetical protein
MASLDPRGGLPISIVAHAVLIAWGVWSLPLPQPVDASSLEQIPVDFVEIEDVTKLTKGMQTAALVQDLPPPKPKVEEPPPLPKPEPPPPPEPEPAPVEQPQPDPPPLPPPPPPQPDPAPPPPTPSPEALAPPPEVAPRPLKNVPVPRVRPKVVQQAQAAPKPKPKPQDRFDVDKLTAMLDQPTPEEAPVADKPPVGSPTASASGVKMTASELDALRARLAQCWNPPVGWIDPAEVRVVLLLSLNADGSVSGQPQVLQAPQGQFARQAPESALRAVRRCAPYNLPPDKYDAWREVKVTFDPQDMGRI